MKNEKGIKGWWNDFWLGMRLLRYSRKKKMVAALVLLLVVFGIMYTFVSPISWMSGLYFLVAAGFFVQQLQGVNATGLVRSSGLSKRLQIRVVLAVQMGVQTIAFVFQLVLLAAAEKIALFGEMQDVNAHYNALLVMGVLGFFITVYYAFVFKYYIVGIITFCIMFFAGYLWFIIFMPDDMLWLPLPVSAGVGYVLILLGGVASYWISRWLYRKEFSAAAFRMILSVEEN